MEHRLYRMFDQAKPSPAQEEAILARLLETGRKTRPRKKVRLSFVALAAVLALLVTSVSAAVVIKLNPALLELWGVGPEEEHLLSPAAVEINKSHTYLDGWNVEVSQALADHYTAAFLVDITAPRGAALAGDGYRLDAKCEIFSPDGGRISNGITFGSNTQLLEDGDPLDGHLSLLYTCRMYDEKSQQSFLGSTVRLSPEGLSQYNPVLTEIAAWNSGWRCSVSFPETDPGLLVPIGRPVSMGGAVVTLKSVYVTPLTLVCNFEGGDDSLQESDWLSKAAGTYPGNISLHTRAGETFAVTEWEGGSASFDIPPEEIGRLIFRLPAILDPTEIESITLYGQTYPLS